MSLTPVAIRTPNLRARSLVTILTQLPRLSAKSKGCEFIVNNSQVTVHCVKHTHVCQVTFPIKLSTQTPKVFLFFGKTCRIYINTQSVPRSKHTPSLLQKPVS